MAWRGEDVSKAQPDVAGPALWLAAIRGGAAGPGTRQALGRPSASRACSERAAAGRAGPAGEVMGCGLLGLALGLLWEPGAGWGATGVNGVGVARGRGGRPPPPALTERGLVAWLGLHDPLVERRGRGKRRKRRSAGEALLRESFAWDLESLFLSPDCGAWVRGNRWKLYFVPKCQ